jgi:hypothetical protein
MMMLMEKAKKRGREKETVSAGVVLLVFWLGFVYSPPPGNAKGPPLIAANSENLLLEDEITRE